MIDANTFNIAASIVSIILSLLAIIISIWFFVLSKNTENRTTNSLSKIEQQAESLQKISVRWMDRLTRYVTTDKPSMAEESFPQLLAIISQLPQTITASITQISTRDNTNEQLIDLSYTLYIAIYFYSAQTNYWSQTYLPKAAEFDEKNEFHQIVKRVTDMSASDFVTVAKALASFDQDRLNKNSLAHLLNETKEFWRFQVKSVADIYIAEQK